MKTLMLIVLAAGVSLAISSIVLKVGIIPGVLAGAVGAVLIGLAVVQSIFRGK